MLKGVLCVHIRCCGAWRSVSIWRCGNENDIPPELLYFINNSRVSCRLSAGKTWHAMTCRESALAFLLFILYLLRNIQKIQEHMENLLIQCSYGHELNNTVFVIIYKDAFIWRFQGSNSPCAAYFFPPAAYWQAKSSVWTTPILVITCVTSSTQRQTICIIWMFYSEFVVHTSLYKSQLLVVNIQLLALDQVNFTYMNQIFPCVLY